MHDSQVLEELLASDNTASGVWADSAYRSKDTEAKVKARGLTSRIHRKASRNRPLRDWEKAGNQSRSRFRARIEHVFGAQHNDMGGTLVRSMGLVRARARIGLKNLAYNMRRLVHLQRLAMVDSQGRRGVPDALFEGARLLLRSDITTQTAICRLARQSHSRQFCPPVSHFSRRPSLEQISLGKFHTNKKEPPFILCRHGAAKSLTPVLPASESFFEAPFTRTDKFRKVSYQQKRFTMENFTDLIRLLRNDVESRRFIERFNNNSFKKARNQLLDLMHTKSYNWEYEEEWRAWSRKENLDGKLYFAELEQCELREILIGFRCPKQSKIKSQVRKLIAQYPDPPPKIFFTQRSLSTYEIERVAA